MPYYPPYIPGGGTGGGGGGGGGTVGGNQVVGETPSGIIDGVNRFFTLARSPLTSTLKLYFNGLRQKVSIDFSFSDVTIVYNQAPHPGDILLADYEY